MVLVELLLDAADVENTDDEALALVTVALEDEELIFLVVEEERLTDFEVVEPGEDLAEAEVEREVVVAEATDDAIVVEVAEDETVVKVAEEATGPPTVIARTAGLGSASNPD